MAVNTGAQLADFTLPDDGGASVSLQDLRGRSAVLFFYPKDDTSSCTLEAKEFSDRAAEFSRLGASVLGISPDSVRKHGRFKTKHGLSVRLLSDENKELVQACGIWVEKSMYGNKYMGVERTTLLLDPAGKIARVWEKVKVPGHADEVLEAARQLNAGLAR